MKLKRNPWLSHRC